MIWLAGMIAWASLVATVFVYNHLPATLPIHFGTDGAVSVANKSIVWVCTGLPVVLWLLFFLKVRPLSFSSLKTSFSQAMQAGMLAVVGFLIALAWALIAYALGFHINMNFVVKFAVGCLFLIVGAVIPRIEPNPSFGLRYPWIMHDNVAWKKTHRLGGWGLSLIGLAALGLAFIDAQWSIVAFMVMIFGFLTLTSVYSWRVHTKEKTQPKR
ncbi:SdpI family protein [Desulfovibrio inopinatus]|uniref:SdpI family protein n=1 Tax=Desulfovibrio inopinatus TaxID=102109 RepID=UPI0003FE3D42|nr:SdpI family protein [Desulfovibrio inopinatus]